MNVAQRGWTCTTPAIQNATAVKIPPMAIFLKVYDGWNIMLCKSETSCPALDIPQGSNFAYLLGN
jgi:hypothetical protein